MTVDDVTRLGHDIRAVADAVDELDRRISALQLLGAADDGRHIERATVDAAGAAADLHRICSLLGGRGLLDHLRDRAAALAVTDLTALEAIDALGDRIAATQGRVSRSAMLTRSALTHLERQLGDVLGAQEKATVYTGDATGAPLRSQRPRLVDRMA